MTRTPSTKKRRWAWTLTIIAALLAVVWVGSMKVSVWVWMTPCTAVAVLAGSGLITIVEYSEQMATADGELGPSSVQMREWSAYFSFDRGEHPFQGGQAIAYWIPLWPFVLLTGVPGVWMLITTRKHTNPNACPACGYDRTGLPQTSTGPAPCPECGKR